MQALPPLPVLHGYIDCKVVSPPVDQIFELIVMEPFERLRRSPRIFDYQPQISVKLSPNDCNLELHQIHSQCSSFISEDILNLS